MSFNTSKSFIKAVIPLLNELEELGCEHTFHITDNDDITFSRIYISKEGIIDPFSVAEIGKEIIKCMNSLRFGSFKSMMLNISHIKLNKSILHFDNSESFGKMDNREVLKYGPAKFLPIDPLDNEDTISKEQFIVITEFVNEFKILTNEANQVNDTGVLLKDIDIGSKITNLLKSFNEKFRSVNIDMEFLVRHLPKFGINIARFN